jgi:hypothetical protein
LEWEVDYIGKLKACGKRLQYFVHWHGYPDSAAERLPAATFSNAPDKVHDFWEFKGQPCPHSLSFVSHFSEGSVHFHTSPSPSRLHRLFVMASHPSDGISMSMK